MKTNKIFGLLIALSILAPFRTVAEAGRDSVSKAFGRHPIYFVENRGQDGSGARFYVRRPEGMIRFTDDGIRFDMRCGSGPETNAGGRRASFSLRFCGANEFAMSGHGLQEYRESHFSGADPAKWFVGVPSYGGIVCRNVYEGIDAKIFGTGANLEYEFVVSPGADPGKILLSYEGVSRLEIGEDGELAVHAPTGVLKEKKPYVYQDIGGERKAIEGRFRLAGDGLSYGFEIGAYDPARPLVVDPVLYYSTYFGNEIKEYGWGIATDSSGATYVAGYDETGDQTGNDAFVCKLSPSGEDLVYAVWLKGGTDDNNDRALDIVVDDTGAAYVTGNTASTDFPVTAGAYQTEYGGGVADAFVVKINPAGDDLLYGTFLGGSGNDNGLGIALGPNGNAYVSGRTYSTNFPVKNYYSDTNQGSTDIFVSRLNASGSDLVFSTYIGGGGQDYGWSVAADGDGNAYVGGFSESSNFPVQNPVQGTRGDGSDAIALKLSSSGDTLIWSTYLGGSGNDSGYDIAIDATGSAYVVGQTESDDFPATPVDVFQSELAADYDAFVAKFSPAGDALEYATYLGGNGYEDGRSIALDGLEAWTTGVTGSTDFPVENPYQGGKRGNFDAFATKLSADGKSLVCSTYMGGATDTLTASVDFGLAVASDADGFAFVTGYAGSVDFPVVNAYQSSFGGGKYDAFVLKYEGEAVPLLIELAYFNATLHADRAVLEWETLSEIESAGFHVLRSACSDGSFMRITDAMIPARGSEVEGGVYSFEDLGAGSGECFCYRLEDIDYNGLATIRPETGRSLRLEAGWNLVAGDAFDGLAPEEGLGAAKEHCLSVWTLRQGRWLAYFPGASGVSDMENFEAGSQCWIYMDQSATLALQPCKCQELPAFRESFEPVSAD